MPAARAESPVGLPAAHTEASAPSPLAAAEVPTIIPEAAGVLSVPRAESSPELPTVRPQADAALAATLLDLAGVAPAASRVEATSEPATSAAVAAPVDRVRPEAPRAAPLSAPHPAAETGSGLSLPVARRESKQPTAGRARSRQILVACSLAGAGALGVAVALFSTQAVKTAPREAPALEPAAPRAAVGEAPTAKAEPPKTETPKSEAGPERAVAAPAPLAAENGAPAEAVEPTKLGGPEQAAPELSGHSAPGCEQLMAAHRAPRKANPLQYDYVHHLHTARKELIRGKLESAHAAFCRATLDPGADVNVFVEFAQLLVMRRDGAAALPWVEKALAVEPKNPRARGLLGDALLLAGRTDEARSAFLAAANRGTDEAAIERLVRQSLAEGDGAKKASDLPRAERFFRRVLAFDPENAQARERLSAVSQAMGAPAPE